MEASGRFEGFFALARVECGTPLAGKEEFSLSRESRTAPPSRTRWRFRLRPALGNRPMLWKELYTGRPRGLAQFVGLLLTVIAGGFLAYYTYWMAEPAIREIWDSGNAPRTDYMAWANRNAFMWFLLGVVPLIYIVGILGVAGAAAASITSEHEEDTWVSLTATDLTGREIIFAKMFGAMKRGLKFAGVIVFLATLGALVGSISPLSIPLLILAMGIYAWAAAALGLWISLHLRTTWRAQFLTMASLLLINVFGQGVLNMLSRFGFAPQLWPDSRLTKSPSCFWILNFSSTCATQSGPTPGGFQPWTTASPGERSSASRAWWPIPRWQLFCSGTLSIDLKSSPAEPADRQRLLHLPRKPFPPATKPNSSLRLRDRRQALSTFGGWVQPTDAPGCNQSRIRAQLSAYFPKASKLSRSNQSI